MLLHQGTSENKSNECDITRRDLYIIRLYLGQYISIQMPPLTRFKVIYININVLRFEE